MKTLRHILFFLFTLAYMIGCPLIILYILGRAYNPQTNELVKTGVIHLNSAPANATVYLNNKRYPEKTPVTIRDLPLGRYTITLTSPDHRSLEKTVTIADTTAITLDHILLIPRDWTRTVLADQRFAELLPVRGSSGVFVRQGPALQDLFLLKLYDVLDEVLRSETRFPTKTAELLPIAAKDDPYATARIRNIFTVDGSANAVVQVSTNQQNAFLWVNMKNTLAPVRDISALFSQPPQAIRWDPADGNNLLSLQDHYLNRLNIPDKAIYPHIMDRVHAFTIRDHQIYALMDDHSFQQTDYSGAPLPPPAGMTKVLTRLSADRDIAIETPQKDVVIFKEGGGRLLFNQPPFELPLDNIQGLAWDTRRHRLLVWTRRRLGIASLPAPADSPAVSTDPLEIQWLVTGKRDIRQAFWVFSESHVLYTDADRIYLADATPWGVPLDTEITAIQPGSLVYYSEVTGRVYFLAAGTGQLTSIDVIPPLPMIPPQLAEEIDKLGEKKDR